MNKGVSEGIEETYDNRFRWPGLVVGVSLFGTLWVAIKDLYNDDQVSPKSIGRTADVGEVLLTNHVLAFEVVSVLLLAALIGAIVLARRG